MLDGGECRAWKYVYGHDQHMETDPRRPSSKRKVDERSDEYDPARVRYRSSESRR